MHQAGQVSDENLPAFICSFQQGQGQLFGLGVCMLHSKTSMLVSSKSRGNYISVSRSGGFSIIRSCSC